MALLLYCDEKLHEETQQFFCFCVERNTLVARVIIKIPVAEHEQ